MIWPEAAPSVILLASFLFLVVFFFLSLSYVHCWLSLFVDVLPWMKGEEGIDVMIR